MNTERKLASIRKVSSIQPIEGADAIEIAVVDGWKVVTKKGEYVPGSLCIYCEIDSFLPIKEEFEFLRKSSYKKMGDQEGFRLRTIKLRGQVSQGLLLPLTTFQSFGYRLSPNLLNENYAIEPDRVVISPSDMIELSEGSDVTEVLGIVKYEPPIPAELSGKVKGNFPSFLRKTDEERVQNLTKFYNNWVIGPFVNQTEHPQFYSENLEFKWSIRHEVPYVRQPKLNNEIDNEDWKSLCVLTDGKFNIQFQGKRCKLTNQGDFVYWYPNLPHTNYTDTKSTLFTIRWLD